MPVTDSCAKGQAWGSSGLIGRQMRVWGPAGGTARQAVLLPCGCQMACALVAAAAGSLPEAGPCKSKAKGGFLLQQELNPGRHPRLPLPPPSPAPRLPQAGELQGVLPRLTTRWVMGVPAGTSAVVPPPR